MNKDTLKGQWQQMKGSVKRAWGKLTDDDIAQINGSIEKLSGKLRERYGYDKERVQKEMDKFSKENDLE